MSEQPTRASDEPSIETDLPGPRAEEVVASDERFVSQSAPRAYPLVIESADGLAVTDVDGNTFWDFASGIAVTNVGHGNERVVEAAKDQLDRLVHAAFCDYYTPEPVALAERLAEVAPGGSPKQVYYGNSGAEAIEAGIKLARHHTGRPHLIAFEDAFHGRTMGAVSLTASKAKYRHRFGPLMPAVDHVPFPDPYRMGGPEAAMEETFDALESLLRTRVPAEEVAGVVVEPIQGEGGYVVPPDGFYERLRGFCDDIGALLIADEIQTGFGRTGEWFAMDHWGVEPDVTCMGKGIANGLPMSAMVARDEVMSWEPGAHASTFHGNPVIAAAGRAVLDVIEEEELLANAREVGDDLLDRLREIGRGFDAVGDVRGKGLMIGVELIDPETGDPAGDLADAVMEAAWHRGLMVLPCGRSVIRFAPPLTITGAQARRGAEIFEAALEDAAGE